MIYVFDFETTANTAATAKKKTVLPLTKGVTYQVDFLFPPGPAHLLHVQITHALHSVWPTNPSADFAADNETISFNDAYPLIEPPFELDCYTWNTDDTFDHRVIIRIGVSPIEIVEPERIERLLQSWQVPIE